MDHGVLAERWYEERQDLRLSTDAYHGLKRGLRDFLPPDALAGVALRDGEPVVIALAKDALLAFVPPAKDALLDAMALPIERIAALAVTSAFIGNAEATYRSCHWALSAPLYKVAPLETRRPVGAGFGTDSGGEAVMLALAERLGWPIPLGGSEEGKG
jgi:hypothetical protein